MRWNKHQELWELSTQYLERVEKLLDTRAKDYDGYPVSNTGRLLYYFNVRKVTIELAAIRRELSNRRDKRYNSLRVKLMTEYRPHSTAAGVFADWLEEHARDVYGRSLDVMARKLRCLYNGQSIPYVRRRKR